MNMKKLLPLLIVGILVLNVCGAIASNEFSRSEDFVDSNNQGKIIVQVSFPNSDEYQIVNTDNGQRIEMIDLGYLTDVGKPMLPVKKLLIALPPAACVKSVDFKVDGLTQLPGTHNIMPVPEILLLEDSNQDLIERLREEWQENYELTYSSDDAYPNDIGGISGSGSLRKYSYVSVYICPFKYYPLSGKLFYYDSAEIEIHYDLPAQDSPEEKNANEMKYDTLADESASKLFINYDKIKKLYEPMDAQAKPLLQEYDYVIITTDDLSNAITSSNFLDWKTSLGYNVRIVKISDEEIANQPGLDLAEQIRNFLREHYTTWGIQYVLLVGDYESIPMRYCYPDSNNHLMDVEDSTTFSELPTDYYYADLSYEDADSWDSDGDGYYGEYGQDNPDFLAEVYVGRIPTSIVSRIIYTLNKLVSFEQDTGDWKDSALHGGAILFFENEGNSGYPFVDGARLCNAIETDLMNGWTISHYSEQEGLNTSGYDWPALSEESFEDDWRNGKYGIVNWAGHGAPISASRIVWTWDDGDGIMEGNEGNMYFFVSHNSNLDDDYPSIVFAVSCNVGYPEFSGGLGTDLLTKPGFGSSAGVVSASRCAAVTANFPLAPGGSESICYEFNHYMINGPDGPERLGKALYNAKFYCNHNYGWDHLFEYINMYDYNLYGDPSMVRSGISDNLPPDSPTIDGPTKGKPNKEIEFTFTATDPEDSNVWFWIDWGDEENTGWIGPYSSDAETTVKHTWTLNESFTIKAKAKDSEGAESDWATFEVAMPKNKAISSFLLFLERIIERFPIFEQLQSLN